MTVFRCFPWDRSADPAKRGGALWFPRELQGRARHDNPDLYGCLYASETSVAAVVEQLAPFRARGRVRPRWLRRAELPLALAEIDVGDEAALIDLDDPSVLVEERLRPSEVASGDREATQAYAARLFDRHEDAAGLRWWSTLEASWPNVTVFDRAARLLTLARLRELTVFDGVVREAADFLGLAP